LICIKNDDDINFGKKTVPITIMKVAYDYQIFSLQQYGGISRYYYEISKRIARYTDAKVKIFAAYYLNHYLREKKKGLIKGKFVPHIPKTSPPRYLLNYLVTNLGIRNYKPDILHETYYSLCRIEHRGLKRVVTIYDMIPEKFPETIRAFDFIKSKKKKALNYADHIICISENTKNDLLNYYKVNDDKVSVVHLGVSMKGGVGTGPKPICPEPYILYVGSRSGYKNYFNALKAFASSPRLNGNFYFVSFGGGKYSKNELRKIQEIGLNPSIIKHYSGDDGLLKNLYSYASAMVYPSRYEGFGLPILEAMKCGCPVICSNTMALTEIAGNAAEFFSAEDVEEISNVIENVVHSETKRNEMIKNGYDRAKQFSWDKCASKTFGIYSGLVQ
jgi:glycosyltransferase involved in cell wall biosynthesis